MSSPGRRQGGFTLIELVMFIIVVGLGLAGIVSVFNMTTTRSADPMIRKQMLSIAEALLEEVALQPFTYCDPELDADWTAAASPANCTTQVEGLGPEGAQVRVSAVTPFNNVSDYNGLALDSPITDISGGLTTAPASYSASIAIVPENLNGIDASNCWGAVNCSVRIAVTVCRNATQPCPAGADNLTLEGYRARYWPNDQPW